MTLISDITVEITLPDGRPGGIMQSRNFECFLDRYRVLPNGDLICSVYALEERKSEETDEEKKTNRSTRFTGLFNSVLIEEKKSDYTGFVVLETSENEKYQVYTARFKNGSLIGIRVGHPAEWAPDSSNEDGAMQALCMAEEMISTDNIDQDQVLEFIRRSINNLKN